MFLSALTDPEGVLVVKSWKLDGSSLVKLDTYRDDSRVYSEVSMAGPLTTDVFNGSARLLRHRLPLDRGRRVGSGPAADDVGVAPWGREA